MNKLLKLMGYKTITNRWDMEEIYTDLGALVILAICITIGVYYG